MVEADDSFMGFVVSRAAALRRTAYWLTGDWHLGEDLVQTALIKTYSRAGRLRNPDALEAYVRKVMVTTWRAWWRRKWRAEVPTGMVPETTSTGDTSGVVEQRDWLTGLLAELPRQQRLAVVLRFCEDLSEAETARLMGCSIGTVKTHTSRGLAALRDRWPTPEADSPARTVSIEWGST